MTTRPVLLFVSPWYLFPTDVGGKLRTVAILKHLKRMHFSITLLSPAPGDGQPRDEIESVCDRFVEWPTVQRGPLFNLSRMRHIVSALPIPVATDVWEPARRVIREALAENPDVVVVDFAHTHVLMPGRVDPPCVMFTHNVEAEIFERHAAQAADMFKRLVWRNQHHKMLRYEGEVLRCYDQIVTVSERDTEIFCKRYGLTRERVREIPTGIDMDGYDCRIEPKPVAADAGRLVFTAAMSSAANIDAVEWFMDDVWPVLTARRPKLEMVVVGRNPPGRLISKAKSKGINWTFTGSVPSVEPYVHDSDVFAIPLRVGGGTRLKVVEAIAMGAPIVSTDIGVEGIDLEPDRHYVRANTPQEFADGVDRMLADPDFRRACASDAHAQATEHFSAAAIARAFQDICLAAIDSARERRGAA